MNRLNIKSVAIRTILILCLAYLLNACTAVPVAEEVARLTPAACQEAGVLNAQGQFSSRFLSQLKGTNDQLIEEHVDRFLDCAIGPAGSEELRLYRGHIIVTLLARYAVFNLTGSVDELFDIDFSTYAEMPKDAQGLLARIENAELMLRKASTLQDLPGTDATVADSITPSVDKLNRIVVITMVAIDAETPAIRRTKSFISGLAGLSLSLSSLETLVKTGLDVVRKGLVLNHYGKAYLADVRQDLEKLNTASATPTAADWAKWTVLLEESCNKIAEIASSVPHCIPGR